MKYKPYFVILVLGLLIAGVLFSSFQRKSQEPAFGVDFSFTSTTNATSSIGIYSWSQFATTTPDMGFARLCHNNNTPTANNPVYIGFGATSTKPIGTLIAPGECYTMTQSEDNMFYGKLYAIASTATTTLLQVYK